MADVSGKGLSAAARTARARYALQAFAYEDSRPCSVLNRLNRFLETQPGLSGSFITVFYGVLDSRTGELRCASAGHEPPVLLRKGEEPEFLLLSGVPCGIFPDLECSEARLTLQPGDRFLLYSDGVTEARRDRKLFDFEGLRSALIEEADHPPDTLVRRIYRRVLRYGGGVMRDDVALLIVEMGGVEGSLEPAASS
jgi:sigma-B regulation protein RsbU (phosphoserine phosphatase)